MHIYIYDTNPIKIALNALQKYQVLECNQHSMNYWKMLTIQYIYGTEIFIYSVNQEKRYSVTLYVLILLKFYCRGKLFNVILIVSEN